MWHGLQKVQSQSRGIIIPISHSDFIERRKKYRGFKDDPDIGSQGSDDRFDNDVPINDNADSAYAFDAYVVLFHHPIYRGNLLNLYPHEAHPNLKDAGMNDTITSYRLFGGPVDIVIFEHGDYGGGRREFTWDGNQRKYGDLGE